MHSCSTHGAHETTSHCPYKNSLAQSWYVTVYCSIWPLIYHLSIVKISDNLLLLDLQFATFPHIFLGAFSFAMRNALPCMLYLAFLSMEMTMQLHQVWLPYAFGMIDSERYMEMMMQTGQADRILPKWPNYPHFPVPTTEATYRAGLILLITFVSTVAVLQSRKIAIRHANTLLAFSALFSLLPLLQFYYGGMFDIGLLLAPIYTVAYALLTYLLIFIKTRCCAQPPTQKEEPKVKAD